MTRATIRTVQEEQLMTNFLSQTLPAFFLSFGLFVGGIVLLALRIPGWSIIFGLPAVQIGLIFSIFTYDQICRQKIGPESLKTVACSRCGQSLLVPVWQKRVVCASCRAKLNRKEEIKKS